MSEKTDRLIEAFYKDGFWVAENFITDEAVNGLLEAFEAMRNKLRLAGIGKKESLGHEKKIRSDEIVWLQKNEDAVLDNLFFAEIEELILNLNRRCFLGLNDYEFHFAMYRPGTFYKRHKDVFNNDSDRKVSVILYLNKDWKEGDGGELNIYLNDTLSVKPRAGTLVAFESHIEHEVLVSQKDRISLTGWLKSSRKVV